MPVCWITYDDATCRHCAKPVFRFHDGSGRWVHGNYVEDCYPTTKAEPK